MMTLQSQPLRTKELIYFVVTLLCAFNDNFQVFLPLVVSVIIGKQFETELQNNECHIFLV